ncbi:trypsin-like peptidase domain-containing protein [Methylococcus sp. BF19-07]
MTFSTKTLLMNLRSLSLAVAIASSCPAFADRAEPAQYRPVAPLSAASVPQSGFLGSGSRPFELEIPVVVADLTPENPGEFKTGTVYDLPIPATPSLLYWESVAGGYTARIRVSTANAVRLRLHLVFGSVPPSFELRLQGSEDMILPAPIGHAAIHDNEIWLPVTEGSGTDLEIFVDDTATPEALDWRLDKINLILVRAGNMATPGFSAQSLGYAQYKQYDLACWSNDPAYPALQIAAAATAKINFLKKGASYLCSGTLLNDKGDTQTPWFATANHCLPDQTVADTASFEWFWQATGCNVSDTDSRYSQTFGGAQLLWTEFYRETSFLRLRNPPPANVYFSSWDTAIRVGEAIWGVHHPRGDHTMVSKGKVTALQITFTDSGQGGSHILDEVQYIYGGTEGGSSGSGLFAVSGDSAYWKGSLFGGSAEDYQNSVYSHFAGYYEQIKPWLTSCTLPWGGSIPGGQSVTAYQKPTASRCAAAAEVRTCTDGHLSGSYTYETCAYVAGASCPLPWGGSLEDGQSVTAYQIDSAVTCPSVAEVRRCSDGTLSGSYEHQSCTSSVDPASMTVLHPVGGETFTAGEVVPIQWQLTGYGARAKVTIALSQNGGRKWKILKSGTKNTGSWNWKVKKGQVTSQALIRVCLPRTRKTPAVCDVSDAVFAVQK